MGPTLVETLAKVQFSVINWNLVT